MNIHIYRCYQLYRMWNKVGVVLVSSEGTNYNESSICINNGLYLYRFFSGGMAALTTGNNAMSNKLLTMSTEVFLFSPKEKLYLLRK